MKKVSLFLLGFILLMCLIAVINLMLLRKIYSTENFYLGSEVTQLLAGNSRLAVINPELFDNTTNVSSGGQSYYYTYLLLEQAIPANPQIKRVYIGCSYDNFTKCSDKNIGIESRVEGYFPVLSWKHLKSQQIRTKNLKVLLKMAGVPFNFQNELKLITAFNLGPISQENNTAYGKYYSSDKSIIDTSIIQEKIQTDFLCKDETFYNSEMLEDYFYRILHLCDNEKVELILINPPLYSSYLESIPEEVADNYSRIITEARKKYNDLTILDYSQFEIPDSHYGDIHHLNNLGSKVFVDSLRARIESD